MAKKASIASLMQADGKILRGERLLCRKKFTKKKGAPSCALRGFPFVQKRRWANMER